MHKKDKRYLIKNVTFDFKFGQIFEILFIFLDTKHGKKMLSLKRVQVPLIYT